jgi:hypothetical protein
MRGQSLPALSQSFLDGLRKRNPTNIELPTSDLLSAPETILQIGSGSFLKGFVEDFVQLANVACEPWVELSRFSAGQIIDLPLRSGKTASTHSFCEASRTVKRWRENESSRR